MMKNMLKSGNQKEREEIAAQARRITELLMSTIFASPQNKTSEPIGYGPTTVVPNLGKSLTHVSVTPIDISSESQRRLLDDLIKSLIEKREPFKDANVTHASVMGTNNKELFLVLHHERIKEDNLKKLKIISSIGMAVISGDVGKAQKWLDEYAKIDFPSRALAYKDPRGLDFLMHAAGNNDVKMIKFLRSKGAKADVINPIDNMVAADYATSQGAKDALNE